MINLPRARQIIFQLNRIDIDAVEYGYLVTLIANLLEGAVFECISTRTSWELYRGVKYTKKPTHSSFLGAPPKDIVKGYQRCNAPNQPKFYCSPDPRAVLYELEARKGDKIYLSKWSVKDDFFLNRLIVENSQIQSQLTPVNNVILAYMETIFSRRIHEVYSNDYKITAAIADRLMNGDIAGEQRKIIGLIYPSVADPQCAQNIAMLADCTENHLNLDYVEEVVVNDFENDVFEVTYTDYSDNFKDGKIDWIGRSNRIWAVDPGAEIYISIENGRYLARDRTGNVVRPTLQHNK